jgi:hypothetical protein
LLPFTCSSGGRCSDFKEGVYLCCDFSMECFYETTSS